MLTITEHEVLQVLQKKHKSDKFLLQNYYTKPKTANGLMSEYYHLFVTYKLDSEAYERTDRFFLKIPSLNSDLIVDAEKLFEKEAATYRLFMDIDSSLMNDVLCQCFLANSKALVFSDLELEGYKILPAHKTLTFEEMKLLMKTMAAFNAASIIYEEQRSEILGRPYRIPEDHREAFEEYYMQPESSRLRKFLQSAAKGVHCLWEMYKMPKYLKNGLNFEDGLGIFEDYITCHNFDCPKYRRVISQCDLWASNILVKRENGKAVHMKLVDFQVTRYLPPSNDILHAIYFNFTRSDRKRFLHKMLSVHYEYFDDFLRRYNVDAGAICTYNEFLDGSPEKKLMVVCNLCNIIPLVLLDKEDAALLIDGEDRLNVFLGDRSIMFKKCKRSKYFDLRVKDVLLDVMDFLEGDVKL